MKPEFEFQQKLNALRELLDAHNVDSLLLRRVSSFAWATCGAASYVNTAVTEGAASLVITRDKNYLATNNIEAPRLQQEESLLAQGWDFIISPWTAPLQGLNHLLRDKRTISDVAFLDAKVITAQISLLRSRLSEPEIERFRHLGSLCAEAITATAHSIHPGMSEFEIAAQLGKEAQQRGVQPIVNLIATDERAMAFRHPLPTAKTLNHYVLLVLSGRKSGLVCSISRMVHFGKLPDELQARIQAAAQVNAALIASSRPGKTLGEILKIGQQAYAAAGFPDEWQQHHQGGLTGYEPREILATPDESLTLEARQVVAWNPTVQGAKMEDSVVLNDYGFEVLTNTPAWPLQMVQFAGQADPAPCALALRL